MKNNLSPKVSLLVRPKMFCDEWFDTYLVRLARANGVRQPWRNDLMLIRRKVEIPERFSEDGIPKYGAWSLPAWASPKCSGMIRYCPACLAEGRYIRSRWRLNMLDACTLHDLHLRPGLCEPAFTANYKHPEKREIDQITEQEMWEGATCPSPNVREYAHALWERFERAAAGLSSDNPESHLAWALLAEKLIDAVVTAMRGPGYPPKGMLRLTHRANWLANAGMSLSASQSGVLDFLLGLNTITHQRAALACLAKLMEEEARQATLMSTLPLQYLHDRLSAASPEAQKPLRCGALPKVMHPDGYVSFEETEQLVGSPPSFLYFMLNNGFLRRVEKIKMGKKTYVFIYRSEVEACRRWYRSLLSPEQLQEQLGINWKTYYLLVDAKLLNPLYLNYWARCHQDEVGSLVTRLEELALPHPGNDQNLVPLLGDWLYQRIYRRPAVVEMIKRAWRGELPIYRRMDEPGLTGYYVDLKTVVALRSLSDVYWMQPYKQKIHQGQLSLLEAA